MPQNNQELADIQNNFKDIMLDKPEALNNPSDFIKNSFAEGDIPLKNRLKIYRNNIIGSLTDVMKATFPTIEALVGSEFFDICARTFILQNPPKTGVLTWYGEGFDIFLKEFEPAKELPYLPDIALLEVVLNAAYYAQDDLALNAQDLSTIPPENLENTIFDLRHSVELISSQFPIDQIRDFCFSKDENIQPPDMNKNDDVHLLVYRPNLETQILAINADEFFMLQNFQDNQTLGNAVQNTLRLYPDFDFQHFLQKFMALETFKAF